MPLSRHLNFSYSGFLVTEPPALPLHPPSNNHSFFRSFAARHPLLLPLPILRRCATRGYWRPLLLGRVVCDRQALSTSPSPYLLISPVRSLSIAGHRPDVAARRTYAPAPRPSSLLGETRWDRLVSMLACRFCSSVCSGVSDVGWRQTRCVRFGTRTIQARCCAWDSGCGGCCSATRDSACLQRVQEQRLVSRARLRLLGVGVGERTGELGHQMEHVRVKVAREQLQDHRLLGQEQKMRQTRAMHSDQNRRVSYGLFVQRQQASRRASDDPRTASYRHLLLERHADELDHLHLDGWVTRDPAHQLLHIGNLGTRAQERDRAIERISEPMCATPRSASRTRRPTSGCA